MAKWLIEYVKKGVKKSKVVVAKTVEEAKAKTPGYQKTGYKVAETFQK